MGIPSFYRWLVERYPLVAKDAIEQGTESINGVLVFPDSSRPNPNGLEFDNLYLDMNGIIHPCFHPEGLPAPKTYDEVFRAVFEYIDRILSIVRPRKLLYMAIDGVAPRAKMNQQRTRRFRAAKEAAEAAETKNGREISKSEGEKLDSVVLDSNIITPGTEFMALLSTALRYYVHLRMNEDPGWQGVKVIISDANVPGEGEHKVMSYIRLQRNLPGFDPNTRHCLYGLDADLIMLALATHEIHFSILREAMVNKKKNTKYFDLHDLILRQHFQFLNIWLLRSYLALELKIPNSTVETDLERLIDDFVFMCLLVGNDFLPHVPSLDIKEGAIDLLLIIYRNEFVKMGGYLTDSHEVNLKRVEHFLKAVGSHEEAIFKKRLQDNKQNRTQSRRSSANVKRKRIDHGHLNRYIQSSVKKNKDSTALKSDAPEIEIDKSSVKKNEDSTAPKSDAAEIETDKSSVKKNKDSTAPKSDAAEIETDKVKLGEVGWKERYYTEKFDVKTEEERERTQKDTVLKYVEGICWVMHYYYQGVCSWQWFYPYHYAPFASDLCDLNQLEINFTLGEPFKPFDQLMAVLPAASAQALPLVYSNLMTDPSSPILDCYPSDFEVDMNGKQHAWQGVCRLPFIDESRLLSEIAKVEPMLTDEEKKRNSLGLDMLFVHISHPLAPKIISFFERNIHHPKLALAKLKKKIDYEFSDGMNGYICISDKPVKPVEIPSPVDGMETITDNKVTSVLYKLPSYHPHISKPPEGVKIPDESVSELDLQPPPIMWHLPPLFGRELARRPIPKKSIMGSKLADSSSELIVEYYLGKWKTETEAIKENGMQCVKDATDQDARQKLAEDIENLVCICVKEAMDWAAKQKLAEDTENLVCQKSTTVDQGTENLNLVGGVTTKSKQKLSKKEARAHLRQKRADAGLHPFISVSAKTKKRKRKLDSDQKKEKRKRKLEDRTDPQEVDNSSKQLIVFKENYFGGLSEESKRLYFLGKGKAEDEMVPQEVENIPRQLPVGNENHTANANGEKKSRQMSREEEALALARLIQRSADTGLHHFFSAHGGPQNISANGGPKNKKRKKNKVLPRRANRQLARKRVIACKQMPELKGANKYKVT